MAGEQAKLHLLLPIAHVTASTIPRSMEKLSSMKPVPGAKKVGIDSTPSPSPLPGGQGVGLKVPTL